MTYYLATEVKLRNNWDFRDSAKEIMSSSVARVQRVSPADSSPVLASLCNSASIGRKCSDEWVLAAKRSCLNMTVMEPCVNKAVAHLEFLKELAQKKPPRHSNDAKEVTRSISAALSTRQVKEEEKLNVKTKSPELIAEGVAIGITQNAEEAAVCFNFLYKYL